MMQRLRMNVVIVQPSLAFERLFHIEPGRQHVPSVAVEPLQNTVRLWLSRLDQEMIDTMGLALLIECVATAELALILMLEDAAWISAWIFGVVIAWLSGLMPINLLQNEARRRAHQRAREVIFKHRRELLKKF